MGDEKSFAHLMETLLDGKRIWAEKNLNQM